MSIDVSLDDDLIEAVNSGAYKIESAIQIQTLRYLEELASDLSSKKKNTLEIKMTPRGRSPENG